MCAYYYTGDTLNKEFLKSDKIKIELMKHLTDRKWHSYYDIQANLGMNYNALKKHLNFLKTLSLVELTIFSAEESSSGKGSYKVRITEKGIEWVKHL